MLFFSTLENRSKGNGSFLFILIIFWKIARTFCPDEPFIMIIHANFFILYLFPLKMNNSVRFLKRLYPFDGFAGGWFNRKSPLNHYQSLNEWGKSGDES